MPRAEGAKHGFIRAMTEVISGFIIVVFLNALADSGMLDPLLVALLKVIGMLGAIALVLASQYWGIPYLLGWLFGIGILSQAGWLDSFDFVFFFIIPLIFLGVKVLRRIREVI